MAKYSGKRSSKKSASKDLKFDAGLVAVILKYRRLWECEQLRRTSKDARLQNDSEVVIKLIQNGDLFCGARLATDLPNIGKGCSGKNFGSEKSTMCGILVPCLDCGTETYINRP